MKDSSNRYGLWLWSLMALFCLRVTGQLVQALAPLQVLPAFEHWQGSRLPYPVLLGAQLVIVGIMVRVALRFSRGRVSPSRRLGTALLAIGVLYFVVMALRLMLGLSVLSHLPWFAKVIPAFFHLVLAGYILVVGAYHWRYAGRTVRR
jgi:chromate transport protein ChrA